MLLSHHALSFLVAITLFSWLAMDLVDAWFFSPFINLEKVCTPDFLVCPNSGLAFRDRKHDCAFTPCELVLPGPTMPHKTASPLASTIASQVASKFGREEFLVPALRTRDLVRGKRREQEILKIIRSRVEGMYTAVFLFMKKRVSIHEKSVLEENATRVCLKLARIAADTETATVAVARTPVSRWSLLGQLDKDSALEIVNMSLHLVQSSANVANSMSFLVVEDNSTESLNLVELRSDVVAQLLFHVEATLNSGSFVQLDSKTQRTPEVGNSSARSIASPSIGVTVVSLVEILAEPSSQSPVVERWNVTLIGCPREVTQLLPSVLSVGGDLSLDGWRLVRVGGRNNTVKCSCWSLRPLSSALTSSLLGSVVLARE